MEVERDKMAVNVVYRGKAYTAELPPDATVGELGKQMSQLTGVALHTMRLLVPQGRRTAASAMLPASEQHSSLTLEKSGISSGVAMRMMGALPEEIMEVSQPANKRVEDRVIGFEEEDHRAKQRTFGARGRGRQLPQGPYTFSQFQTLQLPGIELNPPPSQALAILHKLASDPGIVAIMNKHKWQVGMMTELAPVGYVGISPKCLLGFNKNRGQEISLRLRTDDLQGFRKYDCIKKTLLHELAHMVHDEHDEDFHALDKQLNQEAIVLDWTKSTAHTLSGVRLDDDDDNDVPMDIGGVKSGHRLGGDSIPTRDTRSAAAQAAILRLEKQRQATDSAVTDATFRMKTSVTSEPDPDESCVRGLNEPDPDDVAADISVIAEGQAAQDELFSNEPTVSQSRKTEPDPDDTLEGNGESDLDIFTAGARIQESSDAPMMATREQEPDPDDSKAEPDPDDALTQSGNFSNNGPTTSLGGMEEADPDDMLMMKEPNREPDPDEAMRMAEETDPDDGLASAGRKDEPDPDENAHVLDLGVVDDEVAMIQDATAAKMRRLQSAISTLKQQAIPSETAAAINTLYTILRNVIDHPNESKYRQLRKGNPTFQHRVARYEGAVEVLRVVGFSDGECAPGAAGSDRLVLKRPDPALLWLARSSLEASMA